MHHSSLQDKIAELSQAISSTQEVKIKSIGEEIFNLVESVISSNNKLRDENQKLRDELNRLKGEQGKPSIRKQSQGDHSSEKERNKRKDVNRNTKKKKKKINIDRVEICEIDKNVLPKDAVFKGHESVVVQDIIISTDNIRFDKQVYYSPSLKKTFIADLPKGYHGTFGPKLKALIIDLHNGAKMTLSSIHTFMSNHGLLISPATISRITTANIERFHQEKTSIVETGLSTSIYQQMDDTGARENGQNCYTHILCNEWYTSYFTKPDKSRLTIIDILTQGKITFSFNELSYQLMEQMKLPQKHLIWLKRNTKQELMTQSEIDSLLEKLFPEPKKNTFYRRIILDSSAIVAYQQLNTPVRILLTDDAPQFKNITEFHSLCWVHDGRSYKKLNPVLFFSKEKLNDFLERYWEYYHKLLDYKKAPTDEMAESLSEQFDELFSTETEYENLDKRIRKTKLKKDNLLLVLQFPELSLHNNDSELGAREQARYRDISFHTMNNKGTQAKDTFMTIIQTAKKLGVNTYHYLYDRISEKYNMPSLAELIKIKSQHFA